MKKVAFNTGAFYTELGQRIAVQEVESGAVFVDFDRDIYAMVLLPRVDLLSHRDLARLVYQAYLYNQTIYAGYNTTQDEVIRSIRAVGYDAFASQSDCQVFNKRDLF